MDLRRDAGQQVHDHKFLQSRRSRLVKNRRMMNLTLALVDKRDNQTTRERVHSRGRDEGEALPVFIEAKKEEEEENDQLTGREQMINADVKWQRIANKLAKKSIIIGLNRFSTNEKS
ncbi:hypothetical protein R1sor_023225 [Riccia sorocarpa]|uniref:Uncharacterized protein n=1 Tax=Riccia sorocarpa TaxID=122646 RepID=A0ABD3GT20_9MARC